MDFIPHFASFTTFIDPANFTNKSINVLSHQIFDTSGILALTFWVVELYRFPVTKTARAFPREMQSSCRIEPNDVLFSLDMFSIWQIPKKESIVWHQMFCLCYLRICASCVFTFSHRKTEHQLNDPCDIFYHLIIDR